MWVECSTPRGGAGVTFQGNFRERLDQSRQGRSSWFSVLGSRFSVLGSWFSVLSSQFSVLSSQFSVPGSQFLVLSSQRAIRKPDLWYHDGDHAVLMRSNFVCHDVRFDPIQPSMRPI